MCVRACQELELALRQRRPPAALLDLLASLERELPAGPTSPLEPVRLVRLAATVRAMGEAPGPYGGTQDMPIGGTLCGWGC